MGEIFVGVLFITKFFYIKSVLSELFKSHKNYTIFYLREVHKKVLLISLNFIFLTFFSPLFSMKQ